MSALKAFAAASGSVAIKVCKQERCLLSRLRQIHGIHQTLSSWFARAAAFQGLAPESSGAPTHRSHTVTSLSTVG